MKKFTTKHCRGFKIAFKLVINVIALAWCCTIMFIAIGNILDLYCNTSFLPVYTASGYYILKNQLIRYGLYASLIILYFFILFVIYKILSNMFNFFKPKVIRLFSWIFKNVRIFLKFCYEKLVYYVSKLIKLITIQ